MPWSVAMTVHVLGHVLDTLPAAALPTIALPQSRTGLRSMVAALATGGPSPDGITLAIVVINSGWMNTWTHVVGRLTPLRSRPFALRPEVGDHQPDV